jgi:hypothetical protein
MRISLVASCVVLLLRQYFSQQQLPAKVAMKKCSQRTIHRKADLALKRCCLVKLALA